MVKVLDEAFVKAHVLAQKTKESATNRKTAGQSVEDYTESLSHLQAAKHGFEFVDSAGLEPMKGLETIYLADNLLQSVTFPATLKKLKILTLQNNLLRDVSGLGELSSLRKLYLDMNCVTELKGLEGLTNLEELHLDRQKLGNGEGLEFDPNTLACLGSSLKILSCINCGLTDDSVQPLALLMRLDTLEIQDNLIKTPEALSDCILPQMQMLRILKVHGNPLTRDPKFRDKFLLSSDTVLEIDGREVTLQERQFLLRFNIHKLKSSAAKRTQSLREENSANNARGEKQFEGVSGRGLQVHPGPRTYSADNDIHPLPLQYNVSFEGDEKLKAAVRSGAVSATALAEVGLNNPNSRGGGHFPTSGGSAGKGGSGISGGNSRMGAGGTRPPLATYGRQTSGAKTGNFSTMFQ